LFWATPTESFINEIIVVREKILKSFLTCDGFEFYECGRFVSYRLTDLFHSVYFFALTQKSNKKSQGYRKMAKNYCVSLDPGNSLRTYVSAEDTTGSNSPGSLVASPQDGLLRNFLNAIFLRPSISEF